MAKSSDAGMSIERNKLTVRAFIAAAYCHADLAAIDAYLAPELVDHSPMSGLPPTRDGLRLLFAALRTAFPDLQATIHDQVAEGDKVVTRKTIRGTHLGPLMGIPATGRSVAINVIDIVRLVDGRYAEHWGVNTLAPVLAQLRS